MPANLCGLSCSIFFYSLSPAGPAAWVMRVSASFARIISSVLSVVSPCSLTFSIKVSISGAAAIRRALAWLLTAPSKLSIVAIQWLYGPLIVFV